jgi:TPP-dependent 2-oxoacid decarboxylase
MKPIRRILTIATLSLLIGTAVAYYNTSSFGYDDANIISFNNEEVKIFDFDIKYDDVKDKIEKVKQTVPETFITI